VFEGACASCHDWTGVSLLDSRATLTGSRAVNDPSAINIAQIVLSGSKWQPSEATLAMPAFGAAYSDREIGRCSQLRNGAIRHEGVVDQGRGRAEAAFDRVDQVARPIKKTNSILLVSGFAAQRSSRGHRMPARPRCPAPSIISDTAGTDGHHVNRLNGSLAQSSFRGSARRCLRRRRGCPSAPC